MSFLLAIVITLTLQAPFGEAEAQVLGAPAARTIDVTVEVEGTPAAVIARLTGLAGELDPVAMVPRGQGRYGQVIQLTAWEDLTIVFEYIDAEGETAFSEPATLSELGIDVVAATPTVPVPVANEEPGIDPWLLAGLAAALAAIVVLAFWASGGLSDSIRSSDWTFAGTAAPADDDPVDEPLDEPAKGSSSN